MKKKYTKKQITNAISHWKRVLRNMNESVYTSDLTSKLLNLIKQLQELASEIKNMK